MSDNDWQTYVIAEIEGDAITKVKVGKTHDIEKRLRGFKTGNANRLKVLHLINGDHEDYLHALLAAYKIRGEWFQPNCIPVLRKILGIPAEENETPVRIYGVFTKPNAEKVIAGIGASDAIDPRQVISLLAPFRPGHRARMVDGDLGALVRRLRSKHSIMVDNRMRSMLKSTGAKESAIAGYVAKYSQLYDDLCRWDDGTGEVQEKWALSCFGWKPARKVEMIKIEEIEENVG